MPVDHDSVRTEHHQVEERLSPSIALLIGQELVSLFQSDGDPEDLENGITHLRVGVTELCEMDKNGISHPRAGVTELCEMDKCDIYLCINNLGTALMQRFRKSGQLADLTEAVGYFRTVTAVDNFRRREFSCHQLALALHELYLRQGKLTDLQDAITHLRIALALRDHDDDYRSASLNDLGFILLDYYHDGHSDEHDVLEEIISLHRDAVRLSPPGHSTYAVYRCNLGSALRIRFHKMKQMADLEEAISLHRESLRLPTRNLDQHSNVFNDLGLDLFTRFEEKKHIDDLEEAINCHRSALNFRLPDHPDHPTSLNNLGIALHTRFKIIQERDDVDQAICCLLKALECYHTMHPDRPNTIKNIANMFWSRFKYSGSTDDLNEALSHYRTVVALLPPEHRMRTSSLRTLGEKVEIAVEELGDSQWLDDGIGAYSEILDHLSSIHPDRASSLTSLANLLLIRFKNGQIETDLNRTIALYREAVALYNMDDSQRFDPLYNLGVALQLQYDSSGSSEDLRCVIDCYREALAHCSSDSSYYSLLLYNLSDSLLSSSQLSGNLQDLEESIDHGQKALISCPTSDHRHPLVLNNLAIAFTTRFEMLMQTQDIDAAIKYHTEMLALCPPGHSNHFASLNNLGLSMQARGIHLSQTSDIETAINLHAQALALCSQGNRGVDCSSTANNYGTDYYALFGHSGQPEIEHLETAISSFRDALSIIDHPRRAIFLENLGAALWTRYIQLGQMSDLEGAIESQRHVLESDELRHATRVHALIDLGNSLTMHFLRFRYDDFRKEAISRYLAVLDNEADSSFGRSVTFGNLAAIILAGLGDSNKMDKEERSKALLHCDEAIRFLHRALELEPDDHPQGRQHFFTNLGFAYETRYNLHKPTVGTEDLDQAITYHHDALRHCPQDDVLTRSFILGNLGNSLLLRGERLQDTKDLKDASRYLCEAEEILPVEHHHQTRVKNWLGSAYLKLATHEQTADNIEKAFKAFRQAADRPFGSSHARLHGSLNWVTQARAHQHQSLTDAYSHALSLLDRCLITNPSIEYQHQFLNTIPNSSSIAVDAAASAIEDGKVKDAVKLVEQGKGILWSRMRGYRHSLDGIRELDEALAADFDLHSAQLEALALSSGGQKDTGLIQVLPDKTRMGNVNNTVSFETRMKWQRIASEKWDETVMAIRQLKGHSDFLQPPSFDTLQHAAKCGPVIVIIISKYRSDAVIVLHARDPVLVPLPKASPEVLNNLSTKLQEALEQESPIPREPYDIILRSLWENVVRPIVDKLLVLEVPQMSRLWWCPTGPLCGLPIHAAGPYKEGERTNLPDLYISSYISTLSSLIKAREGLPPQPVPKRLLVVGQPDDPTLPNVKKEISRIKNLGNFANILVGEHANKQAVLESLKQHSWVHFTGHGLHHPTRPFQSSFQLHDEEQLRVLDIMSAKSLDADFAFLCACHTAAGDNENTPNEVIHPAAALQFCGFRSVVGTLWEMMDVDGPELAERFYRRLFRQKKGRPVQIDVVQIDVRDTAEAMHKVVSAMRLSKHVTPNRWIPFIHMGV
jgi:tetratricopeptide (TPR) repeat protein/CHAT domain-containing protein